MKLIGGILAFLIVISLSTCSSNENLEEYQPFGDTFIYATKLFNEQLNGSKTHKKSSAYFLIHRRELFEHYKRVSSLNLIQLQLQLDCICDLIAINKPEDIELSKILKYQQKLVDMIKFKRSVQQSKIALAKKDLKEARRNAKILRELELHKYPKYLTTDNGLLVYVNGKKTFIRLAESKLDPDECIPSKIRTTKQDFQTQNKLLKKEIESLNAFISSANDKSLKSSLESLLRKKLTLQSLNELIYQEKKNRLRKERREDRDTRRLLSKIFLPSDSSGSNVYLV